MSSFRNIIDLWPSRAAFGRDVGASPQSVWNMYDRDSIPPKFWKLLVEKAAERGFEGVTLDALAGFAAKREAA